MSLNLSVIEQGIKDVLAEQVKNRTWDWIREIKTYGGEFDADVETILRHFPAIWVTFVGSSTPEKLSHNKTRHEVTFAVLVGSRSVRNEESRRHGAGSDIGSFAMLDHVQRLLIGNTLASTGIKGLAPLELGKTKTIFNTQAKGQSVSVLSQEFSTSYIIKASDRDREEDATDDYIETVNINYHFEPGDGIVDESDEVQLKDN